MGSTVFMALGLGGQLPPGLAGGTRVVQARGQRPAQTPGYIVRVEQEQGVVKRAKREQLSRVQGLSSEGQAQNLVLAVLHVPCLLESGSSTLQLQRFAC